MVAKEGAARGFRCDRLLEKISISRMHPRGMDILLLLFIRHVKGRFAMSDEKTYKFVCVVCGFEVEVDTPELPEDYICPVCGVGPDQFEAVEE